MSIVITLGAASLSLAQEVSHSGPQPRAPTADQSDEQARAALLGVLMYTKVNLKFDEIPVRQAIDELQNTLGIRIIGRYSDDRIGFGIDPDVPVSLEAQDLDALSVLEEVLEQCEVYEDCTWQLRKGFVEVGTKERLSVPAARETRLYHIRDFMIEAPQFGSPGNKVASPTGGKYERVMLGTPAVCRVNPDGSSERRKAPEDLALEIVEGIVETIEPGMWDTGEPAEPGEEAPAAVAAPGGSAAPTAQPVSRALTGVGKWAAIRLWRDQLIVRAPDFIHRQINGYPRPIPPPGMGHETADSAAGLTPGQP